MLSLIVRIVKSQTTDSTACYGCTNPYTGNGGGRCKSGSRSLLTCKLLSSPLDEARSCRNELANDDIFFETHQVIRLSLYRCLCQDTCVTVDALHLFDQVHLHGIASLDA